MSYHPPSHQYQQQLPPPQVSAQNHGSFGPFFYQTMYKDANTLLKINFPQGEVITARAGAMVGMSPNIKIEGKMKGLAKLFSSGKMFEQKLIAVGGGPAEVLLAPRFLGDILPIVLDGRTQFNASKGQFLAKTQGVEKITKSQSLGSGFFSGEGLFIDVFGGQGLLFLQVLGAVHPIDLAPGQEYVIDNGHLVAWETSTRYCTVQASGFFDSMKSGEGLVCRFTGPGRVYIQTRNPEELKAWITSVVQAQ
ncbi:hypothetical protein HK099_004372 [Clydaea vesicula]|uniref:Altered inheritance of mitochondria protein 24, mitochondrial n=1 Tax=Clydaea vesicula TaxID=447962 RepID=A0AAD5U2G6_9FUNG|nr:hypothetical protein HK099_004372 [Clydaea vesicula]KAJ3389064.1 hypothetical protein HDU92_001194 [Lobulomyces angularis]